jgi:Lrp/AsnC family leucine-responsive transcriptional regulator
MPGRQTYEQLGALQDRPGAVGKGSTAVAGRLQPATEGAGGPGDPEVALTMTAGLDHVDRRILELLRRDGRRAHSAIAKEVGLSGAAVHDRVKKLEQRGVIAGYSAILDPDKLGREHVAFCMVTLSEGDEFAADEPIVARICEEPDVLEFHRIAGQDCYLIKIRSATNKDIEALLRRIRSIRGVARTRTTIVLSTELEKPTIEVPRDVVADAAKVA